MLRPTLLPIAFVLVVTACKPLATENVPDDTATQVVRETRTSVPFVQNNQNNNGTVMTNSDTTGLQLISSDTDELGFRHIRYQQMFKGVPVWQSETIMHINKDNEIYRVDGAINEIPAAFDVVPEILSEEAASIASESLGSSHWKSSNEQLNIAAVNDDRHRLVWLVELKNGLNRKFVLVDAKNGETVKVIEGNWS